MAEERFMNDAIRPRQELRLTVICKSCGHQYGSWRPRCTACGTDTPPPPKSFTNPPKITKRQVLGEVARQSKSACIFCRQRKAKDRCPHCNELIHRTCQAMHDPECIKFQQERIAAITRLEGERP
jgi:hypothetical protein